MSLSSSTSLMSSSSESELNLTTAFPSPESLPLLPAATYPASASARWTTFLSSQVTWLGHTSPPS